jgi:hypothetical protein
VSISLQRKPVIKSCLFEVDIYIKIIFNRPDDDIETLEVNVPALYLSPVHHNSVFCWINGKFGSLSINSKISDSNIFDLKEPKEQADLFRYKWSNHIIYDIGKLVEEFLANQIDEGLFSSKLYSRVGLNI